MPHVSFTSTDNRNIELEYDHFGNPTDPALLLIMGFTAQMVAWEEEFCQQLANRGHFVIRFDNRDCGLSTKLHGVPSNSDAVIMAAMMETEMPPVAYTLSDMAADAMQVLDHLNIERAHIMGASMGGMIAQTVAIEHPHRVKTLISIMSQPGELTVGQPTQEAMELIVTPAPTDRDEYIAFAPKWQLWQSKKYRSDEVSRRNAIRDFDRSNYPEGGHLCKRQQGRGFAETANTNTGYSRHRRPTHYTKWWRAHCRTYSKFNVADGRRHGPRHAATTVAVVL